MDGGLLRLLIVGYCVAYTVSECPLKMEPSAVVVRYGDPVSVNCTVSEDHKGIGWEASEGSVDMVSNVTFVIWSLETLRDWEIRPKCFGNFLANAGHDHCDKKLNITVYKPPDSVSISAVNHTGPMLEGEDYQLQCEVQNIAPVQYLTVKWYKGETLENQTSYYTLTKTPVTVSSTLLITPTSADDGAQYSCVAELELGPEGPQPPPSYKSDPFNITVRYPPFFYDDDDETLKVPEGEGVLLRCSALGNPLPAYSWSSSLNQEEKTSQIQITSLPPGTHVYTCTASNQLGQQSKKFTVKVVPQECPLKMEPSTVVVRYGDPVLVNCTVSGDHEGIGWEASEGSVDTEDSKVKFLTWSLEELTDWDIRPKCYVNFYADPYSGFQCHEELNITVYKPSDSVSISAVNHTGPMLEGKQYQLHCEVQNIAPVQNLTVKWYKGEKLESQTSYDALTKTPVNVSSTLLITPTSADDGAQYSCVAELELGPEGPQPPPEVKSDPFNMIVRYSPFFSDDDDDETLEVTEGEGVLLRCSAQGNPLPAYSWSSPLNEEEKTSQTQITSTSLPPGTHVYTCTASNQLGQQSKNFTVKVVPQGDQTVLWMVSGIGLAMALFLILGYLYYKSRDGANSII